MEAETSVRRASDDLLDLLELLRGMVGRSGLLLEPMALDYDEAVRVTGYAKRTLEEAVASGDLKPCSPQINNRGIRKVTFFPEELRRWLANDPPPKNPRVSKSAPTGASVEATYKKKVKK